MTQTKWFLPKCLILKVKELLFRNVAMCVLVNKRNVFKVKQSAQIYLGLLDPEDGDVLHVKIRHYVSQGATS